MKELLKSIKQRHYTMEMAKKISKDDKSSTGIIIGYSGNTFTSFVNGSISTISALLTIWLLCDDDGKFEMILNRVKDKWDHTKAEFPNMSNDDKDQLKHAICSIIEETLSK